MIGFGQSYHTCISGDCVNGYGTFLYDDAYWRGGQYHQVFKGAKYEGNWKDGKFHGEGSYTWAGPDKIIFEVSKGDKYVGDYIEGMRNGKGTMFYFNGDTYVGEFKDDIRHGQGTYTYADGRIEQGEWKNNRPLVYHLDPSIPKFHSLEQYCPKAINQGPNPFCATYSISTIATIIYAKEKGLTDQIEISKNRFSPTFLHYIFPESENPKRIQSLGKFISHYGLPFMKDFEGIDFDGNLQKGERFLCDDLDDLIYDLKMGGKYPIGNCTCIHCLSVTGNSFMDVANEFKVCSSDWITLESPEPFTNFVGVKNKAMITSLNKIKEQIYLGNPCLYVDDFNDLFYNYSNGYASMNRNPVLNTRTIMHGVVIIGYDDNMYGGSYRILNSWGNNWGDDGKAWIRYQDIDTINRGIILSYGKGYRYNQELSDIEIKTYFMNLDNKPTYKNKSSLAQMELDTVKAIDNCRKFLSSGIKPNVVHGDDNDLLCKCFVKKLKNIHKISPISSIDIGEVINIMTKPFDPYDSDPSPIPDTEYKVWGDVIWDCWNEYMDNLD